MTIKRRERKERRARLYDGDTSLAPDLPLFVSIDGEGTNREPDELGPNAPPQDYTLLCMTGPIGIGGIYERKFVEYYGPGGLSTEACLLFLLGWGWSHKRTYISFSFNYDVTKILHDLSPEELTALWKGSWVLWQGQKHLYYIHYIPGKLFHVGEFKGRDPEHINKRRDLGRNVLIYDVFGFFQKSFVKSLEMWGVGKGAEVVDHIAEMKQRRNDFVEGDKEEIRRYCFEECDELNSLMSKVAETLWGLGIYLDSWHGAGAIAAELLKQRNIGVHIEKEPDDVTPAVLGGYYGGRMEIFRQGILPAGLYNADLQSAYPSAAMSLPELRGGRWRRVDSYQPASPYALYRVQWDVTRDSRRTLVGPLPYRKRGRISYPHASGFQEGDGGWCHGVELTTALALYGSQCFKVLDGWIFQPCSDELPYTPWVENLLRVRLQYKREENPRHIVLKLGANSFYGKLAQAQTDPKHSPPYLSYYWAGLITATTRARMLQAAYACGAKLVAIATDGLFCLEEPVWCPSGEGPGEWERAQVKDSVIVIQPGVMYSDRKKLLKTRGYGKATLNYEQLAKEWVKEGPFGNIKYTERRFVPIGASVARRDFRHMGRWVEYKEDKEHGLKQRNLRFGVPSKWYNARQYDFGDDGYVVDELAGEDDWPQGWPHPRSTLLLPRDPEPGSGGSDPYVLPHLLDERMSLEFLKQQVLRLEQGGQPDFDDSHEVKL